jgi:hypothetical protein
MKKRYLNNAKYFVLPVVLLIIILISGNSSAQTREYLLKAGFIEKFTRFIEWPEITNINNSTIPFTISVIGESKFNNSLEKIFNNVKVKNKKVHIKYISSVDEIGECMILIISESKKDKLNEILNYTSGKPILTIGETAGYGKKGVLINMFVENNFIRYEINRKAFDKSGLKASSLLLASAVIVEKNE